MWDFILFILNLSLNNYNFYIIHTWILPWENKIFPFIYELCNSADTYTIQKKNYSLALTSLSWSGISSSFSSFNKSWIRASWIFLSLKGSSIGTFILNVTTLFSLFANHHHQFNFRSINNRLTHCFTHHLNIMFWILSIILIQKFVNTGNLILKNALISIFSRKHKHIWFEWQGMRCSFEAYHLQHKQTKNRQSKWPWHIKLLPH